MATDNQAPDEGDEDESAGGGVGLDIILSYLAFAARAIKRRKWLLVGVIVLVSSVVIGLVSVWPRTYRCAMTITAQYSPALKSYGGERIDALGGASLIVRRRESLEAISKSTDLAKNWAKTRSPLHRIKDRLMEMIRGPVDPRYLEDMMVATLESKLWVETGDGTVTFVAEWGDAAMAARLVETAYQNFLEARHVQEISTVAEYISILEGHSVRAKAEAERINEDLQKSRDDEASKLSRLSGPAVAAPAAAGAPAPRPVAAAPASAALDPAVTETAAKLKVLIEAKERTIQGMEDDRAARIRDLQNKLTELKLTYTDEHPFVSHVILNLDALSKPSAQVVTLQSEVKKLRSELAELTPLAPPPPVARRGSAPRTEPSVGDPQQVADISRLVLESAPGGDPALIAQLGVAVQKHTALQAEIGTARIALDTAQAAFKHRYKIVRPAEIPIKPIKPDSLKIVGIGVLGSLVFALLLVIALELRSGRIVERWQVHQLGVPILGELRMPASLSDGK